MRILLILVLVIFNLSTHADTLHVHPDKKPSLLEAIDMASPGDVILVYGGVHDEGNVRIDKPLHVIGINDPVIDGRASFETVTIAADSVTFEGFTVQNTGYSYTEDWAGIRIEEKKHCTVKNNKLINTFFGIYLQQTSNCTIENNTMLGEAKDEVNSGNGIHLWYCNDIEITDNKVTGHRDGIYFEFVENSTISGNISKNNIRYGMHFMFSNHDVYRNNVFSDNGTGVAVMFSDHIVMEGNEFSDNWGTASYGLLLKEITDGELSNNVFRKNTVGIYADGSLRLEINNNTFNENGWAMNMLGSSDDNRIADNNFIANTFDVATNKGGNDNTYINNYWDQYSGYDLDKDGLGDVPYRPVKVFSYVVGRIPESIILLRSFFIEVLNFAERVTPVLTPDDLEDAAPRMKRIQ